MGMHGNLPSIAVCGDGTLVALLHCRVCEAGSVVAGGENQLIGHQALVHQIQGQLIGHLLYDKPGLVEGVRAGKNLSSADAAAFRLVGLDICHGAGFNPPGMVDKQLCIDAKETIKQLLAVEFSGLSQRAAGDVSHGIKPVLFQFFFIY